MSKSIFDGGAACADEPRVIEQLELAQIPRGQVRRFRLHLTTDAFGSGIMLPVLAARGKSDGPVLGLTAALHGNELNGIPVVQRLFQELAPQDLKGTVVGVPVLNVPGFLHGQRIFTDDSDLNRIMPGKEDGNESQAYAYRLIERLCKHWDYHLDFHTASFGRANSHYVRADMDNPRVAELARLQNARIIVTTPGEAGTMRPVLAEKCVHGLTVELCDPHVYQPEFIEKGIVGARNVLVHLGMLPGEIQQPTERAVECDRAFWMYTDNGGLLEVIPSLCEQVTQDQVIARLSNIFGDLIQEYAAPQDGIIVGKSVNPINQTGGRILYLGIPK